MSAGTDLAPTTAPPETDANKLCHLWCTECAGLSQVAMCGFTSSTTPKADTGNHCAVCEDLADAPCPTCGVGPLGAP